MSARHLCWLLLAVAVLPYFVNLGATSIIDANEAFYTETPREMIEAGDYLNSTFNYEPRFNKPPLSYWVVLGSYRAFGISLWSARFPIALGAVVMIGTAFFLGRLAFSPLAGWIAAISLAATPRFLLFSRRIIIDIYSAMFLGATLLCFAMAESSPDPARRRRWLLAMYVATGLGVLTKGPVAVVIPGLVFSVYLFSTGRLRTIRHMMMPAGALVVAAVTVPYYAALYLEHGWDYITTFLVQENLARYAEGVGAPYRGPQFYLPVVFTDFYFPWSILLPVALALVPWRRLAVWRSTAGPLAAPPTPRLGPDPVGPVEIRLLLGLWIALIVAFFSASRAQQDLYVLPFIPAGAALVGGAVAQMLGTTSHDTLARRTRVSLFFMLGCLGLLGLAAVVLLGIIDGPVRIAGAPQAGAVLLVAAVVSSVALARRATAAALVAALVGVVAVHWAVVTVGLPDFERYKPVPKLAAAIKALPVPASGVGTYRVAVPSLVFYLQRHVDQLFDEQQLREFLSAEGPRYCVIPETDYRRVRGILPMATRVVVSAARVDARLEDLLPNGNGLPNLLLITTDR